VGKDEIEYNNKFKLYITTNISNPHYTPEITTKVTLVNFQVKESGLEEQLLDKVFAKEESTFEKTKNNLVQKISESKTMIKDLEDKILKLLKESKVALLDDLELIEALKTSKETADEVKQALEYSEQNMKKIEMTRDKYRHCAQKASILYFVLDDLAKIDPMYQFSLEWYMNLFTHSITESSESGIVDSIEERVQAILKHHKEDVYKKACRSLFEKHKLLLSLQIVVKLQLTDADMEEWNFFLKGGTVLDRKDQSANPAKDWISQNAWDNICELDKLTQFGGIIAGMLYNTKEWKKWYLTQRPENENLPGEWETKCEDSLRKMIILRCLRPDRMILKAQKFVEDHLSAKFIDNKPVSLLEIYNDSTPITPIIFVLSPGVDPLDQLLILKNQVKQTELVNISLGQGQSARARAALSDATQKGSWVYFANCHLALSWLTELESLIENLPKANPVDSFRLFLSSSPHPKFPIGILQKSVKMTTEPPKGIKANMMKIYNNLPQDKEFITPNDRNWYAKTIWGLAWFHSILVERKKFKTLGWNVLYDFNDSDFSVCENLIEYYAEKSQELSKHISKWYFNNYKSLTIS
jgi:dynein heavy chain, axonemal